MSVSKTSTSEKASARSVLTTKNIAKIAILSAIATVLMLFEFPLPFAPSFYKFDFSEIAVLLGAFAMGPVAGALIEAVKIVLNLLFNGTITMGVGELANFLMGAAFVMPAGLIYKHHKTKKTAVLGCVIGSITSGAAAVVLNYFVLLPLYSGFMPIDQILAMYAEILPFINTKFRACLWAFPGNVFQCALYSVVTMLIYKPLSPLLHRNMETKKQVSAQESTE